MYFCGVLEVLGGGVFALLPEVWGSLGRFWSGLGFYSMLDPTLGRFSDFKKRGLLDIDDPN